MVLFTEIQTGKEKKVKNLAELEELLTENEAMAWEIIRELRGKFNPQLFSQVQVASREDALKSGIAVIRDILAAFQSLGLDLRKIAPGHGIGHIIRDYVHSLILVSKMDINPSHLLIGFIGGTFHDVGCALVPRYEESKRAVRHAEAGAILLLEILQDAFLRGPERVEPILIAYAVAAHTHYLKPTEVVCRDGERRQVIPYWDGYWEGTPQESPFYGIWLPRWVDRLECNGPAFVGRHYLTLLEPHEDYSFGIGEHYPVEFTKHMRPLLRDKEDIRKAGDGQTMLEHLRMYVSSQTNQSPYGKHDFGTMFLLRHTQRERLFRIISAVRDEREILSSEKRKAILKAWTVFLEKNVEPTPLGVCVARKLTEMFRQLDDGVQLAWCRGFKQAMEEYCSWAEEALQFLEGVDPSWLNFSPIVDDVREVIRPHPDWVELLK